MSDCQHLDRRLADYLAGRTTDAEAVALERHAGECERCAGVLEEATRLAFTLPAVVPPPAGVRDAVLARVAVPRRARRRWLVPATIAATLVIGFALTRPASKSAMVPRSANPGAIAASRADGEFERLAAARGEVAAALQQDPDNAELAAALARLDAQRRRLANLVTEFDS